METIILTIHLLIALALVGVVLLQRSEASGLGSSNSTMGGLMTSRASGNFLTRTTGILAACFMATSIVLAIMAGAHKGGPGSSFQQLIEQQTTAPATTPEAITPSAPVDTDRPAPAP